MNTASRLIFTPRAGEAVRVLTCGEAIILEVHILTDRIEPQLSRAGFVADLEMRRVQVQGLICQLADAIGMAVELRERVGETIAAVVDLERYR